MLATCRIRGMSLSRLIDKDGLHPDSDDRAIYADVSKYIIS